MDHFNKFRNIYQSHQKQTQIYTGRAKVKRWDKQKMRNNEFNSVGTLASQDAPYVRQKQLIAKNRNLVQNQISLTNSGVDART